MLACLYYLALGWGTRKLAKPLKRPNKIMNSVKGRILKSGNRWDIYQLGRGKGYERYNAENRLYWQTYCAMHRAFPVLLPQTLVFLLYCGEKSWINLSLRRRNSKIWRRISPLCFNPIPRLIWVLLPWMFPYFLIETQVVSFLSSFPMRECPLLVSDNAVRDQLKRVKTLKKNKNKKTKTKKQKQKNKNSQTNKQKKRNKNPDIQIFLVFPLFIFIFLV